MSWPVAAVLIALILALAGIVRAAIFAAAEVRGGELNDELDQIWNAVELTTRDVERITPIEVSLSDQ